MNLEETDKLTDHISDYIIKEKASKSLSRIVELLKTLPIKNDECDLKKNTTKDEENTKI